MAPFTGLTYSNFQITFAKLAARLESPLSSHFRHTVAGHQLRRNMASINRSFPTFSEVSPAPVDPMFLLKQEYDSDPSPTKVDLGAGVLRDENGSCHEFTTIREAKAELERRKLTHDVRLRLNLFEKPLILKQCSIDQPQASRHTGGTPRVSYLVKIMRRSRKTVLPLFKPSQALVPAVLEGYI